MRLRNPLFAMLLASALHSVSAAPSTRLPTGEILTPAGISVALDGTMAQNCVRIPRTTWVAVLCCGARQSISIVDLKSKRMLSVTEFQHLNSIGDGYDATGDAYYGLAVSPDGSEIYVSRGSEDRVVSYSVNADGSLSEGMAYSEKSADPKVFNFVSGVALDPNGGLLYAANNLTDSLAAFKVGTGRTTAEQAVFPIVYPVHGYPLTVAVDGQAEKVYVSSERDSDLSVIQTIRKSKLDGTPTGTIKVGSHPDALCLSRNDNHLLVANASSDTVSIVDTSTDKVVSTILLHPASVGGLAGATPTGLCLSPDQRTLYVTLADMNAVAVVRLNSSMTDGAVTGYIPTGWYPSSITTDATGNVLVVTNAKGSTARVANPAGPNPVKNSRYYIHDILTSTLSLIPVPKPSALTVLTAQVLADDSISRPIDINTPIISQELASLPIKHVIYIIKENRTYDEVLGDLPQGNGDKSLVLFGNDVTPNLHALETNFVTLDNFYCCSEVSADGWNWSTSGYADEYVQRSVPEGYSENKGSPRDQARGYDYEGDNRKLAVSDRGIPDVSESPGGYIWDSVKKAGLTYRDYGAFLSADGNRASKPALLGHTDYNFCYFNLKYPDSDAYVQFGLKSPGLAVFGPDNEPSRYTAWKAEFDKYVANGKMPSFELVRFMRDHTAGTDPGVNRPQAMAADNDYAVGELVDAVSHSIYWKSTAIFVLEDDAQDGPDHVDCHRSTCYVISPYIKRNSVDHGFYNTDSVLRTMELLLHAPAMTRLDRSAHPLATFASKPDVTPYSAIVPDKALLDSWNVASDYGSEKSAKMNFKIADDAPETALNDILWHSIKGLSVPLPAPRYSALGN